MALGVPDIPTHPADKLRRARLGKILKAHGVRFPAGAKKDLLVSLAKTHNVDVTAPLPQGGNEWRQKPILSSETGKAIGMAKEPVEPVGKHDIDPQVPILRMQKMEENARRAREAQEAAEALKSNKELEELKEQVKALTEALKASQPQYVAVPNYDEPQDEPEWVKEDTVIVPEEKPRQVTNYDPVEELRSECKAKGINPRRTRDPDKLRALLNGDNSPKRSKRNIKKDRSSEGGHGGPEQSVGFSETETD